MKCQLCGTKTNIIYVSDHNLCEDCYPMIVIKDKDTLISVLCGFDPTLVEIVVWILEEYDRVVITCGYREGDGGVHGTMPCRGIDLRSWVYPYPYAVSNKVNDMWEYDPDRPYLKCASVHDSGSGMHLHLQVHKNTKKH